MANNDNSNIDFIEDVHYQKGILSDVTHTATFATIFLNEEYLKKGDTQADKQLRKLIGEVPIFLNQINKSIQHHIEDGFNKAGLIGVVGISTEVIKRVLPEVPESLQPFYRELKGVESYSQFPATGGDIFLHLKSDQKDPCFTFMRSFIKNLKQIKTNDGVSIFKKSEEIDGFLHQYNTKKGLERDLTGFEDGTKNPKTLEAKLAATVIPNRGGSFILPQKWVHDLDSWEKISVEDQEKVFGRKKPDSDKLPNKPPCSHVSLTDLGKKKGEILRHSLPYGTSEDHGLFFLAYSSEIKRLDEMLENMIRASSMNPHLDMMKYIKCVSGQYFYAPTVVELNEMAK